VLYCAMNPSPENCGAGRAENPFLNGSLNATPTTTDAEPTPSSDDDNSSTADDDSVSVDEPCSSPCVELPPYTIEVQGEPIEDEELDEEEIDYVDLIDLAGEGCLCNPSGEQIQDAWIRVGRPHVLIPQTAKEIGVGVLVIGAVYLSVELAAARGVAAVAARGKAALDYATTPAKLGHIFAAKRAATLGPLVQQFGSREAVVQQFLKSLEGLTPTSGIFEQEIIVAGQKVIVRGSVIDAITKIGTALTP
jgi:hypothetical protein